MTDPTLDEVRASLKYVLNEFGWIDIHDSDPTEILRDRERVLKAGLAGGDFSMVAEKLHYYLSGGR